MKMRNRRTITFNYRSSLHLGATSREALGGQHNDKLMLRGLSGGERFFKPESIPLKTSFPKYGASSKKSVKNSNLGEKEVISDKFRIEEHPIDADCFLCAKEIAKYVYCTDMKRVYSLLTDGTTRVHILLNNRQIQLIRLPGYPIQPIFGVFELVESNKKNLIFWYEGKEIELRFTTGMFKLSRVSRFCLNLHKFFRLFVDIEKVKFSLLGKSYLRRMELVEAGGVLYVFTLQFKGSEVQEFENSTFLTNSLKRKLCSRIALKSMSGELQTQIVKVGNLRDFYCYFPIGKSSVFGFWFDPRKRRILRTVAIHDEFSFMSMTDIHSCEYFHHSDTLLIIKSGEILKIENFLFHCKKPQKSPNLSQSGIKSARSHPVSTHNRLSITTSPIFIDQHHVEFFDPNSDFNHKNAYHTPHDHRVKFRDHLTKLRPGKYVYIYKFENLPEHEKQTSPRCLRVSFDWETHTIKVEKCSFLKKELADEVLGSVLEIEKFQEIEKLSMNLAECGYNKAHGILGVGINHYYSNGVSVKTDFFFVVKKFKKVKIELKNEHNQLNSFSFGVHQLTRALSDDQRYTSKLISFKNSLNAQNSISGQFSRFEAKNQLNQLKDNKAGLNNGKKNLKSAKKTKKKTYFVQHVGTFNSHIDCFRFVLHRAEPDDYILVEWRRKNHAFDSRFKLILTLFVPKRANKRIILLQTSHSIESTPRLMTDIKQTKNSTFWMDSSNILVIIVKFKILCFSERLELINIIELRNQVDINLKSRFFSLISQNLGLIFLAGFSHKKSDFYIQALKIDREDLTGFGRVVLEGSFVMRSQNQLLVKSPKKSSQSTKRGESSLKKVRGGRKNLRNGQESANPTESSFRRESEFLVESRFQSELFDWCLDDAAGMVCLMYKEPAKVVTDPDGSSFYVENSIFTILVISSNLGRIMQELVIKLDIPDVEIALVAMEYKKKMIFLRISEKTHFSNFYYYLDFSKKRFNLVMATGSESIYHAGNLRVMKNGSISILDLKMRKALKSAKKGVRRVLRGKNRHKSKPKGLGVAPRQDGSRKFGRVMSRVRSDAGLLRQASDDRESRYKSFRTENRGAGFPY